MALLIFQMKLLISNGIRRMTSLKTSWLDSVVCFIYLSEGMVPSLWDAIFDIKTKKLRNFLGFNTSVFIVYLCNL